MKTLLHPTVQNGPTKNSWLARVGSVAWGLALIIPPLVILQALLFNVADLPYRDEWEFVPMMARLRTGGLGWAELWQPHNEHRVLFLRLLMLGLALPGGWHIIKEVLTSWLLAGLTLLVVWRLVRLSLPEGTFWRKGWLAGASLLLFSMGQWQNWQWGFQMAWFALNLLFVSSVWLLARRPGRWTSLAGAGSLTTVASFLLASGLMIWPTILAGLLLDRKRWPRRAWLVWSGAGLVCYLLYFYNFQPTGNGASSLLFLKEPVEAVLFGLTYLGAPIAGYQSILALTAGLLLLIGVSGSVVWLYLHRRTQIWPNVLPWLQIFVFALLCAGTTTAGRLDAGVEYATASRFTTTGLLAWLGGLLTIFLVGREVLTETGQPKRAYWGRLTSLGLVGLVAANLLATYGVGYGQFERVTQEVREAVPFVYDYTPSPDEALRRVYTDADFVRSMGWVMAQQHLGFFEQSAAQHQAQTIADWHAKLASGYERTSLPASSFTPAGFDPVRLKVQGDTLQFTRRDHEQLEVWLPLNFKTGRPAVIDVQAKQAWYARLYWESEPDEFHLVYGTTEADGWKHFRAVLPTDLSRVYLELPYSTGRELTDSIKVTFYH